MEKWYGEGKIADRIDYTVKRESFFILVRRVYSTQMSKVRAPALIGIFPCVARGEGDGIMFFNVLWWKLKSACRRSNCNGRAAQLELLSTIARELDRARVETEFVHNTTILSKNFLRLLNKFILVTKVFLLNVDKSGSCCCCWKISPGTNTIKIVLQ
jgi:hypothetical protein